MFKINRKKVLSNKQYIYYEIVHEAHKKESKVIDLTITQDCKLVQTV